MTRFLLIRHGLTDAVGNQLTGRSPGLHLNAEGEKQVKKLSENLKGLPIAGIYSSPLERALETAEPIARQLNLQTSVSADFIEIDFGHWTNMFYEEIKQTEEFRLFNSFRSCTRIPGGELMLEAQLRIANGIQRLARVHPKQTIIIVSHADMIKAAIAYYTGIHLDLFNRIQVNPASVSILELFDETSRIQLLNHTGDIVFNEIQ
ncbi:MAG: histidine phosphatase family protein [Candidatus Dadabacteria bacterium]